MVLAQEGVIAPNRKRRGGKGGPELVRWAGVVEGLIGKEGRWY
jgi:hypothetical protein